MSTSTPAQDRAPSFAVWMAAPMAMTLLLAVGVIGYVATSQWPWDVLQAPRGGAAIAGTGGGGSELGEYLPWILLALVTLAMAGLTPWRAGFGVRLATGEHRVLRTVRGAAVYAAACTALGLVSAFVTSRTGTAVASVGEVYGTFDWSERLASSSQAGIWEETVDVAVPVGLAFAAVWIVRLLRGPDVRDIDTRSVPTWCYAAGAFGLVTRFLDHLYQGPAAAAFVVVLGVAAVVVFARYGSVLPLIVGHFVFDAFVAGRTFLPAGSWPGMLLDVGVFVTVVGLTFVPALVERRYRRP